MLPSRLARPGDVNNWTLDIQREFPGQWLVDMAYVGNHGSHLQALLKDPNVAPASALVYGNCLAVPVTGQRGQPGLRGTTRCCHPLHQLPKRLWLWGYGCSGSAAFPAVLRPKTWTPRSAPIHGVITVTKHCRYK